MLISQLFHAEHDVSARPLCLFEAKIRAVDIIACD